MTRRVDRPSREPVNLVTAAELSFAQRRAQQLEDDLRVLRSVIALGRWNTGALGLRGERLVRQRFPTREWLASRSSEWAEQMRARTPAQIPRPRTALDTNPRVRPGGTS